MLRLVTKIKNKICEKYFHKTNAFEKNKCNFDDTKI